MSKVDDIFIKYRYYAESIVLGTSLKIKPSKILDTESAKQQLLAEVLDMITTNQKGTFTDEGGNDCWYIDELVQAAKERFR